MGTVYGSIVEILEDTGTVILLQEEDGKVVGTDIVDDKYEVVYTNDNGVWKKVLEVVVVVKAWSETWTESLRIEKSIPPL